MSIQETVGRQTNSYCQGVVLGLTMAEALLLLVFCLLLAAAVVSKRDQRLVQDGKVELASVRAKLVDVQNRKAQLERLLGDSKIKDDWRRLADQAAVVESLEKAGLSAPEIAASAGFVADVLPLSEEGVTGNEVVASVQAMRDVRMVLQSTGGNELDPEKMAALIDAGMKAGAAANVKKSKGQHHWPPIITLSEAKGQFFETGSARLSPGFRQQLSGPVSERLLQIIKDYNVDIIEVIGHTDEQPLVERPSNLDELLQGVLDGRAEIGQLEPSDNAGLGLTRAVSVANLLRKNSRLSGLSILPYSGAQLIDVGDRLSEGTTPGDVKQRRRIEIRVRQSDKKDAGDNTQWKIIEKTPAAPIVPLPERKKIAIRDAVRDLVGRATVIDGDTIEIHGERIRIWGIDAVESNQTCTLDGRPWRCAQHVAFGLSAHLDGQVVRCKAVGRDRYRRTIATCTARGTDVGSWLVREGLALDFARYSNGAYTRQEAEAKTEKKGLWRGSFQTPWEWRRGRRR